MANLGNTIINGALRVNGKINSSDVISAPSFVGALNGEASKSKFLSIYTTTRPTTADLVPSNSSEYGGLRHDVVSSAMTTNRPASNDGHIITMFWDNSGRYDAQLAMGNGSNYYLKLRQANNGTWGSWKSVAFTDSSITGNAATATKLATARTINGVSFDGTANITVTDSTKLPLAGGTLTGNISYNMNSSTQIPFKVYGGDVNGQGISVGAGGATIVGSGESAKNCESLLDATSEDLWITSDGTIKFYTKCQNIGEKVGVVLDNTRNFYPDTNNTGTLGTSNYKWNNVYATTFTGNLSGNANSATNATNTGTTNTNPTSGTWYYPTWVTGTSGNLPHRANDGYRYYSLQGTTSALGHSYIQIGNATASGTAGNKQGHLRIYGTSSGYTDIVTTASTSNFTITLPAASGTVSLTSHTHSAATTSANGFMSSADKTKLNALHYVRSGTAVPDSSLGENGDIYILLES